jgi:hypothetical protein
MMFLSIIIAATGFAVAGNACNPGPVIQAMSSYPYTASAFCSQYIQPTTTDTIFIPSETFRTTVATVAPQVTLNTTITTCVGFYFTLSYRMLKAVG